MWLDGDPDRNMRNLLHRCREKNLKISEEKHGLQIDSTKIKAILDNPQPVDMQRVQRILGMVNFVQQFAPDLSEVTAL